jgi:hypothetical protein
MGGIAMVKVALLVGVRDYEIKDLPPLASSYRDVETLHQILSHPDLCGFDNVKRLLNPNSLEMGEAIEDLFTGRKRDDVVLFYFSGHGIKDDRGKLYLTARNTRKNSQGLVKASGISASFMHEIMEDSRSKRQIIILDCCYSGAFPKGMFIKGNSSIEIKNQLLGEGKVILTSSSSIQYSFEQKEADFSIYTSCLIEGIKTGLADHDRDGVISITELHEYAKTKVQEINPAMTPEIYALKESYKIVLSKVRTTDPILTYRREVQGCIKNGEIVLECRNKLDALRIQLQISSETANEIEREELYPHVQYTGNLQHYGKVCTEFAEQQYPIDPKITTKLVELQKSIRLKVQDADAIIKKIFTAFEQNLQHKRTQYEQSFLNTVQKEFPLQEETRNIMKKLQDELKLTDEDIELIEKQIIEKKEAEEIERSREKKAEKIERRIQYEKISNIYRDGFTNEALLKVPVNEAMRQALRNRCRHHGLKDEDMSQIEREIYEDLPKIKEQREEKEKEKKQKLEQEKGESDKKFKIYKDDSELFKKLHQSLFLKQQEQERWQEEQEERRWQQEQKIWEWKEWEEEQNKKLEEQRRKNEEDERLRKIIREELKGL